MKILKTIACLMLCIISSQLLANSTDLFQIQTEISEFLEERYMELYDGRIEFNIPSLKSNFKLQPCDNIEYFLPSYTNNSARVTVGIQCNNPNSWTVYLPVNVSVFKSVVKTTTNLARGTIITTDDIVLQETNIMNLASEYYELPIDVIGMTVKRPIQSGKILTKNLIAKPTIIKRGDIVDIVVQTKGILIKTKGMATENAMADDNIKVKNLSSKRIVETIAVSPGIVKVII